jgi:hypothetical protein
MGTKHANRQVALRGVLALLGAVPVASGLAGIVVGPAGAPGGAAATASVDSEYRFVNTFWTAAGVLLWWSLCRPAERARVTRLVLGTATLGGVPRLLAWRASGRPHPVFRFAIMLELVVVPAILIWHLRTYR